MELHVRASTGVLLAVIKGDTALELKDNISQCLDFNSIVIDYHTMNKKNVLRYKSVRNSPISVGDVTFMFWAFDYVYVVM
jgi:hypothetical protein